MSINYDDINTKINKLFKVLGSMDTEIENINKQIWKINNIYMINEFNKNLKLDKSNSYLKFQVDLLKNEKKYYLQIKKIFTYKFVKELYEINDDIILLIITIDNLDFDYNESKKNIMKKILKISSNKKDINFNKIIELVNIIINNLELLDKLIKLFENYILDIVEKNKNDNIHSKTFRVNLMNKKNHLNLEYIKFCNQLDLLVNYFNDFATCIKLQLNKQELLNFFVNTKKDLKLIEDK
jgi:hypothetical protein